MIIVHRWVYMILVFLVLGVSVSCGLMAWHLMIVAKQNRQSIEDRLYLHRENAHNRVILEELQSVVRAYQERDRQRQRQREREAAAKK